MSDDKQPLEIVVLLARDAEQAAGEQLRQTQQTLAESVAQLQAIEAYLEEYAQCAREPVAGNALRIRSDRRFVAELERQVQVQRSRVVTCRQDVEAARARWLSSRMKREALDDVLARRRRREQVRREGREQQRLDDQHQPRRWG